MTDYVAVGL